MSLENNSTDSGTRLVWKDFTCGYVKYKNLLKLYHEAVWAKEPMDSGDWNCNQTLTDNELW